MTPVFRWTALWPTTVAPAATRCTTKDATEPGGASTGDNAFTSTSSGPVMLKDGSQVKLALIPAGAHPYFQPWKTTAQQDRTEFKLCDVTFNETGEWPTESQAKPKELQTEFADQLSCK